MTDTAPGRFIVIGENIHTTRTFRCDGARVVSSADGRYALPFTDDTGDDCRLPVPDDAIEGTGNLNPVTELMSSGPVDITRQLAERHSQAGPRWIVGAGCEIPASTPHANVDALVAFARDNRP